MKIEDLPFITWNYEPGSYWQSDPHLRGTTEYITVFGGTLEIEADDSSFHYFKG